MHIVSSMSVDYLSCGTCFMSFHLSDINLFIEHKKGSCFPTEPTHDSTGQTANPDKDVDLLTKTIECVQCFSRFSTPWSLLMHVQIVHNLLIIDNLKKAQLLKSNLIDENRSRLISCSDNSTEEQDENKPNSNDCQDLTLQPTSTPTLSSVSTQTDLSVLRKKIIPYRKRKYFECCSSGKVLNCSNSAAAGVKSANDPDTCCDPLPTHLCSCTPTDTSSVSSTVCVRSYCCPTLSVYNQPKCVDLSNQSLPESDSSVSCTNSISNCCLRETSCCAVPARVLSVCCNQTVRSSSVSSVPLAQTNQTKIKPVSCCPCPPTKCVTSNSSEAQTDFDPEFSYSDYVDLAMLLASPEDDGPSPSEFTSTNLGTQTIQNDMVSLSLRKDLLSLSKPPSTNSSSTDIVTPLSSNPDNAKLPLSTNLDTLNFHPKIYPVHVRPKFSLQSITSGSYSKSKTHTNNFLVQSKSRSFVCSDCGAVFRQNVHLRKHVMIQHTKQKPYRCSYCNYTTVEKSHLTVHVRTHTGERPFCCRVCNYSSAQNCTLKSHYLRKHPQHLVYCTSCSQGFLTELEMSRHKCASRTNNESNAMILTN